MARNHSGLAVKVRALLVVSDMKLLYNTWQQHPGEMVLVLMWSYTIPGLHVQLTAPCNEPEVPQS